MNSLVPGGLLASQIKWSRLINGRVVELWVAPEGRFVLSVNGTKIANFETEWDAAEHVSSLVSQDVDEMTPDEAYDRETFERDFLAGPDEATED